MGQGSPEEGARIWHHARDVSKTCPEAVPLLLLAGDRRLKLALRILDVPDLFDPAL